MKNVSNLWLAPSDHSPFDAEPGHRQRYYVHGLSYVDERLMMFRESSSKPYYYVADRMYNVVAMIDRGGAIVERIAYNAYGQPLNRQAAARGDMDDDGDVDATDVTLITNVKNGAAWDARGDMDDDGDVDSADILLHGNKKTNWYPNISPTVAQAFSDVGNPYMFHGVPYFTLDTASNATDTVLPLNHHRARMEDPTTGRWLTRDALNYNVPLLSGKGPTHPTQQALIQELQANSNPFAFVTGKPTSEADPLGLVTRSWTNGGCYARWRAQYVIRGIWILHIGIDYFPYSYPIVQHSLDYGSRGPNPKTSVLRMPVTLLPT